MKDEHQKELNVLNEKIVKEMLERGYVPAQVEKLQSINFDTNDILVFQLKRQLPHKVRESLVKNFNDWLKQHKMYGIYLPPDIDLVTILKAPQIKVVQPKENVVIEDPALEEEGENKDVDTGS